MGRQVWFRGLWESNHGNGDKWKNCGWSVNIADFGRLIRLIRETDSTRNERRKKKKAWLESISAMWLQSSTPRTRQGFIESERSGRPLWCSKCKSGSEITKGEIKQDFVLNLMLSVDHHFFLSVSSFCNLLYLSMILTAEDIRKYFFLIKSLSWLKPQKGENIEVCWRRGCCEFVVDTKSMAKSRSATPQEVELSWRILNTF